jgi:two-component system, response regulator
LWIVVAKAEVIGMTNSTTILLVEDNPDDAALTEMALRETPTRLEIAANAQEALDYLFNNVNAGPAVVLLDLRLPDADGLEVLRRLRANDRTSLIPVVILTSSMAPDDVDRAYRAGASSFVRKPIEFERYTDQVRQIATYWLAVNQPPSINGRA